MNHERAQTSAGRSAQASDPMAAAHALAHKASLAFGYLFLGLSIMVALETLLRKLANYSFQGVDELGGYALAIGSTLAFSVAVVERAHMRIDLIHNRLPAAARALLNWLSALSLALFGWLLAYLAWSVVADTRLYGSTAQTPWATPLIWPQSVWLATLVIFAFVPTWLTLRSVGWLARGRVEAVNRALDPRGAQEELALELEDARRR